MTIAFSCSCGATMRVPEGMAGKKGKCPSCGKPLIAPTSSETFSLASSDLTDARDVAISGDTTDNGADGDGAPVAKPAPERAKTEPGRKSAVMRFKCPHCERTLTVPLQLAGQTGKCGGCRERFTAPVPEVVRQLRAKAARQSEPSLRDAFSILKVKCSCGVTSAFPRSRVATGDARCPACDRSLAFDLELASGLVAESDEAPVRGDE
jgi:hypothetical protein